ncbi:MAG: polysaccharide pyruvyl transferase family protein [Longimicrobiales bacterium]
MRSTSDHALWPRRVGQGTRPATTTAAPAVGLLVPCDDNLGDEVIVTALISALRARWERVTVRGFSAHPHDTTHRHGIPAYALSGLPGIRKTARLAPQRRSARSVAWRERLRDHLARLRYLLRVLGTGVAHARMAYRQLVHLDLLIIAASDSLNVTSNHALLLYKWAWLARLARTRVVMLSVSLEAQSLWWSRKFLKGVFARTDSCTFRDAGSARIARQLGWRSQEGEVVPDLALGLFRAQGRTFPRPGQALTVAFAPVSRDKHSPGLNAAFVAWLLEQGHTVLLFRTEQRDLRAMDEVRYGLRPDTLARFGSHLRQVAPQTVNELVNELASVDCVVASRLHGVAIAHALGLPVLALAPDRAAAAHMSDLRQLNHCLEQQAMEIADLTRGFGMLAHGLSESAAAIFAATELSRRQVAAQYARVFNGAAPAAPAPVPGPAVIS